ncbi:MAG: F0F1 ATP synthase subunit delta [Alphaproteobacteria bacterium]|nr:MAG: F0F1 ATP synthase subunit delta [Alphaproteobacteria bacterium]
MEPRPDKKTAKKSAAPYAKAAYDVARDEAEVDNWQLILEQLAEIMNDPELKEMTHDPRLSQGQLKTIMGKVLDELEVSASQRNFVNLLIKDKKLSLLPWIHKGFVQERKKAEAAPGVDPLTEVTIVSAIALTPQQLDNLKATLKKRFNTSAEPDVQVDPDLIGGIKIVIGDRVYDQTIKGQLERLKKHLDKPPAP